MFTIKAILRAVENDFSTLFKTPDTVGTDRLSHRESKTEEWQGARDVSACVRFREVSALESRRECKP